MESRDSFALRRKVVGDRETTGAHQSSVVAYLGQFTLRLALTQNTSGESKTEPTAAMLALRRNTSPILRIISAERRMREARSMERRTYLCERDQFYPSR